MKDLLYEIILFDENIKDKIKEKNIKLYNAIKNYENKLYTRDNSEDIAKENLMFFLKDFEKDFLKFLLNMYLEKK